MGWEKRGNGFYYYRKKRHGRHVISEYMGTGEFAYLFSELDNQECRERKSDRAKWKKQKDEMEKIDSDVDQLEKTIKGFVRAVLLTAGYRPHKGQWRKTRNVPE